MNSLYIKPYRSLGLTLILTLALSSHPLSVHASPVFSDVDTTHKAYSSIVRIAEMGIIVGDTEGKYNPNDYVDKFETAKILARIAGYKQSDYTESEVAFYDKAYEKNRAYLNQYGKTYKKWNTTADRQIAYLLEKEILTPDDLKDFVGIKADGSEGVRALTKENAAMFIIKAVGKKNSALTSSFPVLYLDDTKISAAARPYVYYLKTAGLISGDEKNNYNPREAITKADMAVLLDKVFTYVGFEPGKVTENLTAPSSAGKIESLTATFVSFYKNQDMDAVQLILNSGEKKIYKVSPNVTIYINGFLRTNSDLTEGMTVNAVLNNNEIIDIKADTLNGGTEIIVEDVTNISMVTINGVVLSASSDSVAKTIAVEVKVQNSGETVKEIKSYLLSEGISITRNGIEASFTDIVKGDIITAEVSGVRLYSMKLEQKTRTVEASFVSAQKNKQGFIILTVEKSGREFTLTLANLATITRDGTASTWQELRTGDFLQMTCEYEKILELISFSSSSEVSGVLTELRVTSSGSYITVSGENGFTTYKVIPSRVDVYSLRIGSNVTLYMDSLDVSVINVNTEAKNNRCITGYIQSKRSSSFIMTDINAKTASTTQIIFNDNTIFTDSGTGKTISYADLPDKAKLYVYLDEALKTAIYVTVL